MGEISNGSGISSIRGGDFELGANGVTAPSSSDIVIEDITPILLMPLEDSLELVLGTGPATFTASTIRTFVDKDDGLVKTAAIDVARFEAEGWLCEGGSTNLALHNEDYSNAVYTKTSVTVTPNTEISPDGTLTSDSMDDSDSLVKGNVRQAVTYADSIHTYSTHLKQDTALATSISYVSVNFPFKTVSIRWVDLTLSGNASSDSKFTQLVNDWGRLITTMPSSAGAGGGDFRIYPANSDAAASVNGIVNGWGVQLEPMPFASSVIKTTTTAVTRIAENLSIVSANVPAPTADYTVSMEVDILGLDSTKTFTVYSVDGETSRKCEINTTTGLIEATHGAVTVTSTTVMTPEIKPEIKVVVDATNITLFVDGIQEDQAAKGTVTGTATAISIGNAAGINQIYGHVRNFRIFDKEA